MEQSGRINFEVGLDNRKLKQEAAQTSQIIKGVGDTTVAEGARMDNTFKRVAAAAGAALTIQQGAQFASQIIKVRGEIEALEISFRVLLGTKEKSDRMMQTVRDIAVKSPLSLSDVGGATQMLLSFNIEAEKVPNILRQIGDVSMGNSEKFKSLALAFSQMYSTGKLMGQDLLQMINAGFNPLTIIAEKTGKSIGVLKEEMAQGAISAEMVADAFEAATTKGGKFFNMMEDQSKGINGSISNLKGAIEEALNEIGSGNQGLITGSIATATTLVQNYEKVGKVLLSLVATYGAYKAAVIAVSVVERERAAIQAMIAASNGVFNKGLAIQWLWTERLQKAQAVLNKTMLANPWALAASVLVGVITAMWALHDGTTTQEKAQKRLNETLEKSKKANEEAAAGAQSLIGVIRGQTSSIYEQIRAFDELIGKYEFYRQFSKEDLRNMSEAEIAKLQAEFKQQQERGTAQGNYDTKAAEISKLEGKLNDLISEQAVAPSAQKGARIENLREQVAIAKKELAGLGEELRKIKAAEKEAEFEALDDEKKAAIYSAKVRNLKQQKTAVEETLKEGPSKDRLLSALNTQITEAQTKLDGYLKTNVAKNYEYWEKEKQAAEAALKSFDSVTKGILDKASPEQLKTGKIAGVSDEDVQKYVKNKNAFDEASKSLSVYNAPKENKPKDDGVKEQERAAKELLTNIERQAKLREEIENSNRQARIDAMSEGLTKELEQLRFDHELKLSAIKDYERQLLEAKNEVELSKWVKSGKKESAFVRSTELAPEDSARVSGMQDVEAKRYERSQNALYENLLAKYEDYAAKKVAIEERFNADVLALTMMMNSKNGDLINSRIAEAQKQRAEQIKSLQTELLNDAGLEDLMGGDGSSFVNSKLKAALPMFHSIADATKGELERAKEVIQGIEIPATTLEQLKQAGVDTEALVAALERAKVASTEAIDDKLFQELRTIVANVAQSVTQFANSLSSLGGAAAEVGGVLSGLASNVGNFMTAIDKNASSTDKASAAISSIMTIANMIVGQIARNKQAQEEWNAAIMEGQHQLRLMRIESLEYKQANIFGVENPYSRAIAGAKQYVAAMDELNKSSGLLSSAQVQVGTKKVVSGMNIATGAAAGAVLGTVIPGIGNVVGAVVGAVVGGLIGLFTRKTVPVFESLAKKYGEIFNSETFELNPQIVADYKKLDDESKKIVDNWEEIKNKAKEAQEEMRKNFADLAGDIGTQLSNALVGAYRDGRLFSAIDGFKEYMTGTIEQIMEQLIFSAIFQEQLDELEEKFKNSFLGSGADNDITDDLIWFAGAYQTGMQQYLESMDAAKKAFKEQGFDLWEQTRKAATKGITAASQDSVDETNGRLTTMQGHTYTISTDLKAIISKNERVLEYLSGIKNDTARLEKIESEIVAVKNGIDTMNTKGLLIKR